MKTTALLFSLCLLSTTAPAAEFKLQPLKEGAPKETAAPLKEVLHTGAARILDRKGKPLADLWLRRDIPFDEAKQPLGGVELKTIAEGSFLGVVRFHQKRRDFRDNAIPAGTYTLRSAVQPEDGDHLGVAETRDFGLLAPLKGDTKLTPIPTQALGKLSAEVSGSSHPAVIYLKLIEEKPAKLPALVEDEDNEWTLLVVEFPYSGKKDKLLRLGIVIDGQSPDF